MPVYQFRCDHCDFKIERSFPIKEAIIEPTCTSCDRPMRRLFTAPGVRFVGDGWGGKP